MTSSRGVPAAVRQALRAAGDSPFLTHAPVTRPWLRLVGSLALGAILLAGLVFGLGAALALIEEAVPGLAMSQHFSDVVPETPRRLYGESGFLILLGLSIGLMGVAALLGARIVRGRGSDDLLWPGRPPSARLLAAGFVLMAAICLLVWPIGWLIDGEIAPAPILNPAYVAQSRLPYVLAAGVMLLVAAAAEEVIFRGVLLRLLGGVTRRVWLILLVNGVLFSLTHLDPDPAAFVARALSGMVWTWAALRLGGIEFAVGAHWANNLLIALLGEPMSTAAQVGQSLSPLYLIPELIIAAVMVIAVERIATSPEGMIPHRIGAKP